MMADIGGHPWADRVSVNSEPCIACGERPGTAELGFCPGCWWTYRFDVTRGHAQLAIYLERQAEFTAYLETHR